MARSPFRQRTEPPLNLAWGLANIVTATALVLWRVRKEAPTRGSTIALLVGFWSTVGMFGVAIRRFVDT